MPCYQFTLSLGTVSLAHESNTSLTIKQSHYKWSDLEATKASTKRSRFSWSDADFSKREKTFSDSPENHKCFQSSLCTTCSMVPYGATCTNCHQIQTSKAITLASPPAATWPLISNLSIYDTPNSLVEEEEELLQTLDMDLFSQLNNNDNIPHEPELDEWGRRIYNDCEHRIPYHDDSEGNTVVGYEGFYPSSVLDEYEEDAGEYGRCAPADSSDTDSFTITGYYDEAWYPHSEIDVYDDIDMEQQRQLAEYLAAQNDELPQFSSDRERITAWIFGCSGINDDDEDGDDVSILDLNTSGVMNPQGYTSGGVEFVPGSPYEVQSSFCGDGWPKIGEGYGSMSICV